MDCLNWAVQDIAERYQDETPNNTHEIIAGIKEDPERFTKHLILLLEEVRDNACAKHNLCYECFGELHTRYERVTSEYWGAVATTLEPAGNVCIECGVTDQ